LYFIVDSPFNLDAWRQNMEQEQSTLELVLSLASMGIAAVLWMGVLIGGLIKWKQVRPLFKAGLALGLVILVLKLPGTVAGAYMMDVDSLMGNMDVEDPPEGFRTAMKFGLWLGIGVGLAGSIVGAFHTALAAGLGQLAQSNAYPLLSGAKQRFQGWWIACVIGTLAGVVSTLAFIALDVSEGQAILWLMQTLMPGHAELSVWWKFAWALPTVVAYAIAEEVSFRGIMQGWLIRLMGDGRGTVIGAIVLTSIAWAIGHASNTDAIGLKLTQIFLLGLVFGWLARRYSVEAAIVAHVSLNVVAALAIFWTP
jgi:membrane protease YdiL (CAAX protease family)